MEPRVRDLGEKRLIAEVVREVFDPVGGPAYIGDDCARLAVPDGEDVLASTDRVPADLIAFTAGIADYRGIGRHLGVLNLSDAAAAGARPMGLLFNAGIPSDMRIADFRQVCVGLAEAVEGHCPVVGGDISSSGELSLSATILATAPRGTSLVRSGARPGDLVFVSRPLGLTPSVFAALFSSTLDQLDTGEQQSLKHQLTGLEPMLELGEELRTGGFCTSCMDNTDGVGQTLLELSLASGSCFRIDSWVECTPSLVSRVSGITGATVEELAFGAGADFSLVGTISESTPAGTLELFKDFGLRIVGRVTEGRGVTLRNGKGEDGPLSIRGWDYFTKNERRLSTDATELR